MPRGTRTVLTGALTIPSTVFTAPPPFDQVWVEAALIPSLTRSQPDLIP